MKKNILLIFLFLVWPVYGDEIDLVESVPEETIYGSQMTKRTADVWLEMINSAKENIDFEGFYLESAKDRELEPVIKAVKEKAKSGVKIRFIFEKAMMKTTAKYLFLLKGPNIQYKVINFKEVAGGVQHSKFFIVDNKEVFVGSQNFDWRSLSQVHELGARIKSKDSAFNFRKIFDIDWHLAENPYELEIIKNTLLENPINDSNKRKAILNGGEVSYHFAFSPKGYIPAGFDSEIDELKKIIDSSQKYIKAQVMTYSDRHKFNEFKDSLEKAALRGVNVKLIFSDWNLGPKKDASIRKLARIENIEIKISSIPINSKGFIAFSRVEHLKYLTGDGDKSFISTSNWGYDYFYNTRGAALLIDGLSAAKILEDIFDRDWNSPYVFAFDPKAKYENKRKE